MTSYDVSGDHAEQTERNRGGGLVGGIVGLHNGVFGAVQRALDPWFMGAAARFTFAAVLLMYFWQSAMTKLEGGLFTLSIGSLYQIFPNQADALLIPANFDIGAIPFVPYQLIIYLGTYAEFILPALIVVGLFTRIAAIGMAVFVAVQTYVDLYGHSLAPETVGAWFDAASGASIYDQRLLWLFLFGYLIIRGPGVLSVDWVLGKVFRRG